MNIAIKIYIFIFSVIFSQTLNEGKKFYQDRGEGSVGLRAKSEAIDNAIREFEKASKLPETAIEAGVYLLRSYYYKGEFSTVEIEKKKEIFRRGKLIGESLIEKYPNSAPAHYWYLVNLGSWAQVYGTIAAAREGVADLMKKHSEIIIELDEKYMDGGGYFMLGAVHLKSPYIPFILSWPSNKLAVKYLEKAINQGDKTSLQTVYFARALFKEGRKKEAKDLLTNLISKPLSLENKVEDLKNKLEAEDLIAKWN